MTGGSLSKHTGLLSRSNDIEALKKKIEKLKEKLDIKTAQRNESANSVEAVNKDIANVEAELKTANDDIIMVLGEMRRVNGLV